MSTLTRDGTAEPISQDKILRREREQGNTHFPYSADHEQDLQPYPVDSYSAICNDHTYIITYYLHIIYILLRQNLCQVQPPENIGDLSASRRCLMVRTIVSTVWSAANQNPNYKLQRRLPGVVSNLQRHQK